jgi:hypothetical protein
VALGALQLSTFLSSGGVECTIVCLEWGQTIKKRYHFVPLGCVNLIYLFIFAVVGLELRPFTLSHSTIPIFVKGFLIGFCKLFARAGFDPESS